MRLFLSSLALAVTLQSVNSIGLRSAIQAKLNSHAGLELEAALDNNQALEIHTCQGATRPCTQVSAGGAPYELLIDTGSSVIAFCPKTVIDGKPTGDYICQAYGDGTYGWAGPLYDGELTLGLSGERITSPKPVEFAHMNPGSSFTACGGGLDGIMGVDMGATDISSQPQDAPSTAKPDCAGSDGNLPAQFVKQALVEGDSYSMSFIGLNRENTGTAVIAFGEEATTLLKRSTLLGSAQLMQDVSSWYTLTGPFTFEITGYAGCGSSCKTTWSPEYIPGVNMDVMIVDSGTTDIIIPNPVLEAFNITSNTMGDLSDDVEITITAGTASLTFTVADVMIGGQPFISPPPGPGFPQGVLGWPTFLTFDVQITATPQNVGEISFYKRNSRGLLKKKRNKKGNNRRNGTKNPPNKKK